MVGNNSHSKAFHSRGGSYSSNNKSLLFLNILGLAILIVGITITVFSVVRPKVAEKSQAKILYGLQNPAFDEPYDDHGPATNVARKWLPWWINPPPCIPKDPTCYIKCPSNCIRTNGKCQVDYGCYWMQPEFARTLEIEYAYRVHSGPAAQKIFTYGRMGEFGVYQKVNLQESGTATFSIWMEAWMCRDYLSKCDSGKKSDIPTTMHFKVGIDPTGGTSATSSAVIWSKEGDSFDQWSKFSVSATVSSPVITVFTYARPDWDSARMNNDIYLDDASLTINAKPTPTPGPSLTCTKKAWQDDPRSTKGNYYLVKKYASGSTVTAGQTFVYSIGYENSNAYQFTSTKITDRLPDSVDYVDADKFCSYSTASRTVTCNVGSVAKGQKSQAAIRVKVKSSALAGTLANIGTIQSKTTPLSQCPLDLKIVR